MTPPDREGTTSVSRSVLLRPGVKIPVRDGVQLNATLYLPGGEFDSAPVVILLTPYIADTYHERGMYFASHGMPFAAVDVRGRGNSGGTFRPLIQESNDGYDVVEWVATQSFCNGKVVMWGGSYSGFAQWAAAKESPPHLAAIVPVAAPFAGVDFPMRNNIFYPYLLQWLMYTAGRASQTKIFADAAFWSQVFRSWYESGRSFRDLNAVLDLRFPELDEWVSHPQPDEYWDAFNPTLDQLARLDIPILTITGSYDDNQPGALEHYVRHVRVCNDHARHFLIIGPWDHSGTRSPKLAFGGMTFGPYSLLDLPRLHLEWYAWATGEGSKPQFLHKRVAYYVMGAERWRYADTLAAITAQHEPLFLSSNGIANDIFLSGSLDPIATPGPPDRYRYDPSETHSAAVDAEAHVSGSSLLDQTLTFALRGKQFIYHSAPFETEREVSGFFKLTAWMAIDCSDTDFYVSVHEVCLDGRTIRLSTDALRARYRQGLRNPTLVSTSEPLRYEFERFTFVSRRIAGGHRLRLCIAPMGRLIEATFAEKNYNAGGVVAEETLEHARAVTVTLFHDDTHRSVLHVPLGHSPVPDELSPLSSYLLSASETSC